MNAQPNTFFTIKDSPSLTCIAPVARQITAMRIKNTQWEQIDPGLRNYTGVIDTAS